MLPDDLPVLGDDVRAVELSVTVRGYRMAEVDWLLDRLAQVLDERDAEITSLRAGLHPRREDGSKDAARTPDRGGPDDEGDSRA